MTKTHRGRRLRLCTRCKAASGDSTRVVGLRELAVKDAVSEQLSLALARQVDEVCDRFEDAWIEGRPPHIEEFLSEAPEQGQAALVRELLRIELEHRCRQGEQLTAEQYHHRFPQHHALIDSVLGRFVRSNPSGGRGTETPRPGLARALVPDADERGPSVPLPAIPGYDTIRVLGHGGMGI